MAAPTRLQSLYQQVSLYLPALLMAALALLSWYLVRKNTLAEPVQNQAPIGKQLEYLMNDFSTASYDAMGAPTHIISGQVLRHWNTGETEIERPQLQHHLHNNGQMLASARYALTDDASQDVELKGNVQLEHQNTLSQSWTLSSEHLLITERGEHIHTQMPVQIIQGGNRFSADSLDYQRTTGTVHLQGRVRGVLLP